MDSTENVLFLMRHLLFGLVVGATVLFLLFNVIQAFNAWRQIRWRRLHQERVQYQDVTHTNPAIPTAAERLINSVEHLGFQYMGAVGIQDDRASLINRVYTDESSRVLLLIVGAKKRYSALFYTVYEDGYVLLTVHPLGINGQTPKFEVNSVKTSVDAAYDYHMGHSPSLLASHGEARTFPNMQVVMQWYEPYIRYDSVASLRQVLNQSLQLVPLYVGMLVLIGLALLLMLIMDLMASILVIVGLIAIFMMVVGQWGMPAYTVTVEQRKKKKRSA